MTRFTFRLHEVGPEITGGLILWDGERAEEVLATYRALTEAAPRALTVAAMLRLGPQAPFLPERWHGKPVAGLLVCHSGPRVEADIAPIRALGDPIVDLIGRKPYLEQQSMLDGMNPKGIHYYWKTEFLGDLSDEFLQMFRETAFKATSPLSYSIIFHLAGALNEASDDDGAIGNRDAKYISGFSAEWPPDLAGTQHIAWARQSWERIRRFSTGGNYVNFHLAEDDEQRTRDCYRGNLDRLREIKAQYDPENLFRVNRNIAPARHGRSG